MHKKSDPKCCLYTYAEGNDIQVPLVFSLPHEKFHYDKFHCDKYYRYKIRNRKINSINTLI